MMRDREQSMRDTAGDRAGMTDRVEILENARLVLPDRVEAGWLAVVDGRIAEIGGGRAPERGLDCAGDTVIPGLVELHTDHLESHYAPRPGVRWHPLGAVLAYDAQIAASGITTVFDSLRAGTDPDGSGLGTELNLLAGALAEAGTLSILSSDYVPASLLMAAFGLPERVPGITLPQAVATVTANPARATGLVDRGRLEPGLRADLVRVRLARGVPVVRQVWRAGERVV